MIRKTTAIAAAMALLAAGAGCGSDDDEKASGGGEPAAPKPTTLAVKISGSAKKPTVTVPKSVKGGLVTIELTNEAKGAHGVQLIRGDAAHTPEETLAAGNAWGQDGKALAAWVKPAGGVGSVEPGETATATQVLPAGSYIAVDLNTDALASFEVTGDGTGEVPSGPATISAVDYAFESSGLNAGSNEVLFDNKGKEPHFIAAVPIKAGKTIADVKTFFRTEKGEPPIDEEGGFDTAVIEGGEQQAIELELEQGKYALLCLVPDAKGGPPHVVKGMISEATVR